MKQPCSPTQPFAAIPSETRPTIHLQYIPHAIARSTEAVPFISSDSPTITEGDAFDPYGNVSSVTDPVDGELPRVEAKPDSNGNGWYTIEGEYDTSKEGVYFLTVVACDRNGNQKTKEFTLTVNEAPKPVVEESAAEEPAAQPADNAKDYVVNTNTGKFHRTNCRYVDTIADHNRWDAHIDRQELINQGYEPCKVCKP